MKIRTITQSIGTDPHVVRVRVPKPIGFLGRAGFAWRGLGDALRYRAVEDRNATHFLKVLEAAVHTGERNVLKATDGLAHRLRVELAVATADAAAEVPALIRERTVGELDTLAGNGRRDWAADVRSGRASNAAARSAAARRETGRREAPRILAVIEALEDEAEDARDLWRDHFDEAAGVYTRWRHVWFGRRPAAAPEVPEYGRIRKGRPGSRAADTA